MTGISNLAGLQIGVQPGPMYITEHTEYLVAK